MDSLALAYARQTVAHSYCNLTSLRHADSVVSYRDLEHHRIKIPRLEAALSSLKRDWGRLASRLKTLDHDISTPCTRLNLRLHYPALKDNTATVAELVKVIRLLIPYFCLPRKQLNELHAKKYILDDLEYHTEVTDLDLRALDLFMRVQTAKGRSGEAGELLLFLLTEWLLDAPQIVAKMSLKTNRDMPVYGADGIHAKYISEGRRLILYSGEAKIHARISSAVSSAVVSIAKALTHEGMERELELVRRDIDLSGLDTDARKAFIDYLNPWNEQYNLRVDAVTCLIGFDFDGYKNLRGVPDADAAFQVLAHEQLRRTSAAFARAMIEADLNDHSVELFLLPLPSVTVFQKLFLESIGQRVD